MTLRSATDVPYTNDLFTHGAFAEPYGGGLDIDTRAEQSLDRLAALAVDLFNADTAVLLLRTGNIARVIASSGLGISFRSRKLSRSAPHFSDQQEACCLEPDRQAAAITKLAFIGKQDAQWLWRTPVVMRDDMCLSLMVVSDRPRGKPTAREKRFLDPLLALIGERFAYAERFLLAGADGATAPFTLKALMARTNTAGESVALLDSNLRFRAASEAMIRAIGVPREGLIGRTNTDIGFIQGESVDAICRRALLTGLSPPDCEIIRQDSLEICNLSVSPVSPIGTHDRFVLVQSHRLTDYVTRKIALARAIGGRARTEPSLQFLEETLVARRAIRSRKGINFITLRSWRAAIRTWQISALKALKQNIPADMPSFIAAEIIAEAASLVGNDAFQAVVPMPCSHSCERSCLSLEIGRAVAARLRIPLVQALSATRMPGKSHPKTNVKRPPMVLARPIDVPVLLVDDVATSGAHIEEAVTLLRQSTNSVLAIAWISGDVG